MLYSSGTKPNYLGVQKKSQTLALCPATKNCISTAEAPTDLIHYAPPWYLPTSIDYFSRYLPVNSPYTFVDCWIGAVLNFSYSFGD